MTKLAKKPKVKIPELEAIPTTKDDITCRGCFEGKMKRAQHRRKQHRYEKGESLSTDIMGPLNIPCMPITFKKYFISFNYTSSQYLYTKPLKRRSETAGIIQNDKMQQTFKTTPKWLISDNAGEYISALVEKSLGNMDV